MDGLVAVIVAGVAWLAFCYYQLARHPAKILPKPVWAILILISVPLGGLVYLTAERLRDDNPPGRPRPTSFRNGDRPRG